jgi:hypothetical protein
LALAFLPLALKGKAFHPGDLFVSQQGFDEIEEHGNPSFWILGVWSYYLLRQAAGKIFHGRLRQGSRG